MEMANFKIIIDDSYCRWEYPLDISNNNSIDMVAKKIFKAYKIKPPKGVFIGRQLPQDKIIEDLEEFIKEHK
jgi:hypothetical protein